MGLGSEAFPDMGIWRDIRLEAWDHLRIEQVRFSQEHHQESGETAAVTLTAAVVLEQTAADGTAEVIVEDDSGASIGTALCAIRKGQCPPAVFDIKQPKLWWPNGLGGQPLYRVSVRLRDEAYSIIEEKTYNIGLRTITVSTQTDAVGSEFALTVNGVKMFAMGADYIPEDCIYSRITPERIKQLIETAVQSNFNCLRVWGGGYYPSDEFYDLCDKYGLIVWQDLMFACNIYDMTQDFEENITAEVTDNVRRLRHHASLGLWCGNNEMEMGWLIWEDVRRHSRRLKADYIKQFEYVLTKILQREDQEHFTGRHRRHQAEVSMRQTMSTGATPIIGTYGMGRNHFRITESINSDFVQNSAFSRFHPLKQLKHLQNRKIGTSFPKSWKAIKKTARPMERYCIICQRILNIPKTFRVCCMSVRCFRDWLLNMALNIGGAIAANVWGRCTGSLMITGR